LALLRLDSLVKGVVVVRGRLLWLLACESPPFFLVLVEELQRLVLTVFAAFSPPLRSLLLQSLFFLSVHQRHLDRRVRLATPFFFVRIPVSLFINAHAVFVEVSLAFLPAFELLVLGCGGLLLEHLAGSLDEHEANEGEEDDQDPFDAREEKRR